VVGVTRSEGRHEERAEGGNLKPETKRRGGGELRLRLEFET
jgi:hypothetical protein